MSIRAWVYAVALGITIVPGIIYFGWASWGMLSAYQQHHTDERKDAAQYQAAASEEGPEKCGVVIATDGFFAWLQCVTENIGADGGVKESEYDLKAQQDMAAWAFGMLIVTIWIAVITFVGVIFVAWTLFATRRMAADAREIGEKQARAYLFLRFGGVEINVVDNKDGSNLVVKLAVKLHNSGNTPCYSPIIYYDIQEAAREDVIPQSKPKNMQASPINNSFIPAKGNSKTQLSRAWEVDDPVAFQKFKDRLVRFSYCMNFLDEFGEERWTPIISGTFHHWPEGSISFLPDKIHKTADG